MPTSYSIKENKSVSVQPILRATKLLPIFQEGLLVRVQPIPHAWMTNIGQNASDLMLPPSNLN